MNKNTTNYTLQNNPLDKAAFYKPNHLANHLLKWAQDMSINERNDEFENKMYNEAFKLTITTNFSTHKVIHTENPHEYKAVPQTEQELEFTKSLTWAWSI